MALETGMHSPGVSRLLSELGHEVIVAHARNVRLIGEGRKRDDRLDARTLAWLVRIDPQLLAPVKHRSAEAQAHRMVIPGPLAKALCWERRWALGMDRKISLDRDRPFHVLRYCCWSGVGDAGFAVQAIIG